jgi:hypothetical protein
VGAAPGDEWRAYISRPQPDRPCFPYTGRHGPLTVRRTVASPEFSRPEDYPPVARFSEASNGQPLIGIPCLRAWCEIGPAVGFTPRPPLETGAPKRPATVIKGWHDEQILSIRTGPDDFAPTTVRGIVIPHDDIASRQLSHFEADYVPVATITLEGTVTGTKYARWGLRAGPNILSLRRFPGGDWDARITWPGMPGSRHWENVVRHAHHDVVVPATARWRWTYADDGAWVPCAQGCCQTDGT